MRVRRTQALLAVLALAVIGCGSDTESSGGRPARVLRVSSEAGGGLRFDVRELSATAGKVTIEMANPSAVPHAVAVKGGGSDTQGDTVGKGDVFTVSAELEPGTYSFYCPVGSHEAAGMEETLTVR